MEFTCINYVIEENIAIITLNRPSVLNAMNVTLWQELRTSFQIAKENFETKVIIITGTGRAFSSGADLTESRNRSIDEYRVYLENLQRITRFILHFPKPIIAAINGFALGSGFELALACDIRIAGENAKLGFPEANVSAFVTGGTLFLLQNLIGIGKTKELLYTCDFIDGIKAEQWGLVNKVVPNNHLLKESKKMAKKIADNSLLSISLMKKGLLKFNGVNLESLMSYEVESCLTTVSSQERLEKLKSFHERKKNH